MSIPSCSSRFSYDRPNIKYSYYKQQKKWYYLDYHFDLNPKKKLTDNFLPRIHPAYKPNTIEVNDTSKNKFTAKAFMKRSIDSVIAKRYVRKGLEKILKNYKTGKIKKGHLNLAKSAINYFRKDISTDAGKGKYSLSTEGYKTHNFNSSINKMSVAFQTIGDSRQTLSEFLTKHKPYYLGDCDDFAIALTSIYEIMRNISQNKKGKFWENLSLELKRMQIAYTVEANSRFAHAINLLIIYNKDFTKAIVKPIEPQVYKRKNLEQEVLLNNKSHLLHLTRYRTSKGISAAQSVIRYYYNSKSCFKLK
ncbi:MAG: hypothetical protein U9Q69_02590 [Nanoarchaeota archaeon]|nr:hypothetical protein [Nanoarchaeota archaeon]